MFHCGWCPHRRLTLMGPFGNLQSVISIAMSASAPKTLLRSTAIIYYDEIADLALGLDLSSPCF